MADPDRNVDEQGKFQRRPGRQSERSERVQAPGRGSFAAPASTAYFGVGPPEGPAPPASGEAAK